MRLIGLSKSFEIFLKMEPVITCTVETKEPFDLHHFTCLKTKTNATQ